MNICINVLPNQVIKYKKHLALLEIGIEFSIQNPQKSFKDNTFLSRASKKRKILARATQEKKDKHQGLFFNPLNPLSWSYGKNP